MKLCVLQQCCLPALGRVFLFVSLLCMFVRGYSSTVASLNGGHRGHWSLHCRPYNPQQDKSEQDLQYEQTQCNAVGDLAPVQVPGTVVSSLVRAGVLEDPYYGFNEREFRWTALVEWIYTFSHVDLLLRDLVANRSTPLGEEQLYGQHWHYVLALSGVDTVADVTMSGVYVGRVSNAFILHEFDVTYICRTALLDASSSLNLSIAVHPSATAALHAKEKYPYQIPYTEQWLAIPNRVFLRKPQADFGWDWGPAFASSGIRGGVSIVAYEGVRLKDVMIFRHDISFADEKSSLALAEATIHIQRPAYLPGERFLVYEKGNMPFSAREIDSETFQGCKVDIVVMLNDRHMDILKIRKERLHQDTDAVTVSFQVQNPVLWYPIEYGYPTLYNLTVSVEMVPLCVYKKAFSQKKKMNVSRKVGFRKVELIRKRESPLSFKEESFYVKVNNVPIYAKGTNLVPIELLSKNAFEDYASRLESLVLKAVDANMNMLRVWGGGYYHEQIFYELCDSLGILVWQEFMFACALYPADAQFLNLVAKEVAYQAGRLSVHPSIVIWGGNNENEQSVQQIVSDSFGTPRISYAIDYEKLFVSVVRKVFIDTMGISTDSQDCRIDFSSDREVCEAHLKYPVFIDTSPSAGVDIDDQNMYRKRWGNPQEERMGDIHFYNYVGDCMDPYMYPDKARFVSEFGFQSLPSISAFQNISKRSELFMGSELMQFRQRHGEYGNDELLQSLDKVFYLKTGDVGPAECYLRNKKWCNVTVNLISFVSQIHQALCYDTASRLWRNSKHYPLLSNPFRTRERSKNFNNMGVLYWQLNDVWNAPSWSSIEYSGQRKVLHHFVKRYYEPVIMTLYRGAKQDAELKHIEAHVTSDLAYAVDVCPTLSIWKVAEASVLELFECSRNKGNLWPYVLAPIRVEAFESVPAFNLQSNATPGLTYCIANPLKCVFILDGFYTRVDSESNSPVPISDFTFYPSNVFKNMRLRDPNLRIDLVGVYTKHIHRRYLSQTICTIELRVQSDYVALFVLLEVSHYNFQGDFTNNGFTLLPSKKNAKITAFEIDVLKESFQCNLSVGKALLRAVHLRSLYDVSLHHKH
eukprot:Nk52_evm9s166 gene=Nk52_evmTU9s166